MSPNIPAGGLPEPLRVLHAQKARQKLFARHALNSATVRHPEQRRKTIPLSPKSPIVYQFPMQWNIPNTLTVLRLLAAPGVAIMFLYFHRPWADWFALALFVGAALTDWFDGYLARLWKQESKFGAMMDPIADKAMVVIALMVITGYNGMNPWLILPATVILFREVFVSGLREFLGAKAGLLKVTKLAKWKTTAQMVAIAVLFLGTGLDYLNVLALEGMTPEQHQAAVAAGQAEAIRTCGNRDCASYANLVGIWLLWLAAFLTFLTGWEYFSKSLPYLKDDTK
jgi:CDP-diacylglycerol--glycerol-3-phosphate 3-phosphatidyltransferase